MGEESVNYAIVENGVVINVILIEESSVADYAAATGYQLVKADENTYIGGTYDESGFTPPVEMTGEGA